jgi:eukaryotic-like serine/threonine-protein kinase
VRSRTVVSSEADQNKVVEQNPEAGTTAEEGSTVEISVGGGPKDVTVPDLSDFDEEGARQRLTALKLQMKVEYDDQSDEPEGAVTRQNPEADGKLPENGVVTVWISKASLALVPDVTGLPVAEATNQLRGKGFKVSPRTTPSEDQPAGTVIDQTPKGNSKRAPNSTVTIIVSSGQPSPTAEEPDPDPSESSPAPTPSEPTESAGGSATPDTTAQRGANSLVR